MQFRYKQYNYWFSILDVCYYKQRVGSFDKVEISREEFYDAEENSFNEALLIK